MWWFENFISLQMVPASLYLINIQREEEEGENRCTQIKHKDSN
jgi:hypothetical protein